MWNTAGFPALLAEATPGYPQPEGPGTHRSGRGRQRPGAAQAGHSPAAEPPLGRVDRRRLCGFCSPTERIFFRSMNNNQFNGYQRLVSMRTKSRDETKIENSILDKAKKLFLELC